MSASSDSLAKLVTDLSDYLLFEKEAGRGTVEIDSDVVAALGMPPVVRSGAGQAREDTMQTESDAQDSSAGGTDLAAIADEVAGCTRCGLHSTRTNTVPGEGHASPEIIFVGEAPGADEDVQGRPFVGRAGQLLTRMIEAMGFTRDEVFIANICKCRPPKNRKPAPHEMEACLPYLKAQIALLKPRVIICLGATATEGLLGLNGITRLRGTWHSFEGIDVMPTFHPSYLLRKPGAKHDTWADLKAVLKHIGRPVPKH